jgi:hypothetical protein
MMFGVEGSFLGEELEVAIDPFILNWTVQGFSIVTMAWGKKYCDRRLFEAQSGVRYLIPTVKLSRSANKQTNRCAEILELKFLVGK